MNSGSDILFRTGLWICGGIMGREGVGKDLGNGQIIAIGTTNPGYWVQNLNYLCNENEHKFQFNTFNLSPLKGGHWPPFPCAPPCHPTRPPSPRVNYYLPNVDCHCLCICLCHCLVVGHVFSSLWSNVSKVTSAKDLSVYSKIKRSPTQWQRRLKNELAREEKLLNVWTFGFGPEVIRSFDRMFIINYESNNNKYW